LNEAFPGLQSLDDRASTLLYFDAVRRDEAAVALIKCLAVEQVEDDDPNTICKTKCILYFITDWIDIITLMIKRANACVLLSFFPFVFICMILVWVFCMIELAKIVHELEDCWALCLEGGSDPE
jgi:hypothetical protein